MCSEWSRQTVVVHISAGSASKLIYLSVCVCFSNKRKEERKREREREQERDPFQRQTEKKGNKTDRQIDRREEKEEEENWRALADGSGIQLNSHLYSAETATERASFCFFRPP